MTNLLRRRLLLVVASTLTMFFCAKSTVVAASFSAGDLVRLTRSETLLFNGETFLGAPKGQEFGVLKHDRAVVYVAFFKDDGSLIAVTLPSEALEPVPPNGWSDLLRGVEAFRDQRFDDAKRLLIRAPQDAEVRSVASAVSTRVIGAIAAANTARVADPTRAGAAAQALMNTLAALRETAEQLAQRDYLSVALALDEGTDRLGALVPGDKGKAISAPKAVPPSKLNRADIAPRVSVSNRAVARCRQALALHRMVEAKGYIDGGLKAEPGRPELLAMQARVQKGIADADESYEAANRMKRFDKGAVHALSALDRGLKYCADHPGLRQLKIEMQDAFEERTAPPVTASFVSLGKTGVAAQALEEGRRIYTSRCTECHDLELLDSRSISGWQKAVGSMARRAHIDDAQQAKIIDYLTAAQSSIDR